MNETPNTRKGSHMGYSLPEEGLCEMCGRHALLYPIYEDAGPSHCTECLSFLGGKAEAYWKAVQETD